VATTGGDNTVDRNYWSDYLTKYSNATEIDSSGIGNTPYVFYSHGAVGALQDNHPLMKPVSIRISVLLHQVYPQVLHHHFNSRVSIMDNSALITVFIMGAGLLVYFKNANIVLSFL